MARTDDLLNQAQSLADAGKLDDALAVIMRVLKSDPKNLGALVAATMTHQAKGDHVRAVYHAQRARELHDGPQTRMILALALEQSGDVAGALRELEKLVEGPSAFVPACCRYAGLLCEAGKADEAARRCRAWIASGLSDPQLYQALANALTRLGDPEELLKTLREAVAKFPTWRAGAEWLASAANNVDSLPEAGVVALAKQHATYLPAAPTIPKRPADGTMRIGFVSPDFRTHSVMYFLRPLLEHLDHDKFKIFCYDIGDNQDAMTAELKALGHAWRTGTRLSDEHLVAGIRSDQIDVLIDLAGLTRGARPGIFAIRAAPVQVVFLGYANTTQLPGMDYRIADSLTDPEGSEPTQSGRLLRLDPCFLCYRPPRDLPEVRERESSEPIVFGSFNALLKITGKTIDMWARVLKTVPDSRLFLKAWGLECQGARDRLIELFASKGIARERIEFAPLTQGVGEHLDIYNRVDIGLDSFPYHGTTTTCEALIMGVPVVSRIGDVHRARVGLSILSAIGMSDLAAADDDAFVDVATRLAKDRNRLMMMRSADGLRAMMNRSSLQDEAGYARRFAELSSRFV